MTIYHEDFCSTDNLSRSASTSGGSQLIGARDATALEAIVARSKEYALQADDIVNRLGALLERLDGPMPVTGEAACAALDPRKGSIICDANTALDELRSGLSGASSLLRTIEGLV